MTIRSLLLAASVAALLAGCAKEDDSPQEGARAVRQLFLPAPRVR